MKVSGKHEYEEIPEVNAGDKLIGVHETAADPVATDDSASGYYAGYLWVATTSNKVFVCEDATATAAVWTDITAAGGGGGDVATDTIWDAVGDLVVGSGADTAVRLALGTALQQLRVNAAGTNVEWGSPIWAPKEIALGELLTSGAAFTINDGAGVYLAFDGASDDSTYFNFALPNNGVAYDGSNLAIVLHCRINVAPSATDDVGLLLDYGFVTAGDNSATTVTNVAQQDVVVDAEVANVDFDITLGTMTGGTSGDTTLMISLTRNSTGAGADSYGGQLEVTGITMTKV